MDEMKNILEQIRTELNRSLMRFDDIGLEELDDCRLMNRYDRKFSFAVNDIIQIISRLGADYKVLQVEGRRLMRYETLYYDTSDNAMYIAHHNGMAKRYKIRLREYTDTGLRFLEIKHKNNKGEVSKYRRAIRNTPDEMAGIDEFIHEHSPFMACMLEPRIKTTFNRFTIVNFNLQERITIDSDLGFRSGNRKCHFPGIAVAEIKSAERNLKSPFYDVLRELRILETGFSKYCTGMAILHQNIRKNSFKLHLHNLNQKNNEFIDINCDSVSPGNAFFQD